MKWGSFSTLRPYKFNTAPSSGTHRSPPQYHRQCQQPRSRMKLSWNQWRSKVHHLLLFYSELISSRLFLSGKHSDLTVICGDDKYEVHKSIVCPRSEFFDAACRFGKVRTSFRIQNARWGIEALPVLIRSIYELAEREVKNVIGSRGRQDPSRRRRSWYREAYAPIFLRVGLSHPWRDRGSPFVRTDAIWDGW